MHALDGKVTYLTGLYPDTLVGDVKQMYWETGDAPPEDQQRLVYAGRQLEHGRTLMDYGVSAGCAVWVVKILRGC